MSGEARAFAKTLIALAFGIVLVFAGIAIGALLGPRIAQVELRARERRLIRDPLPIDFARLPDLIAVACPSIVSARSGGQAVGGFFVSANGFVITGFLREGSPDGVIVSVSDGQSYHARLIGSDEMSGLSLVKVDGDSLPYLQLATGGLPRPGDLAIELTSPAGSGCAARTSFVQSDSLVSGLSLTASVLLTQPDTESPPGTPEIAGDGRILGIATRSLSGPLTILPADVAAQSMEMLLRGEVPPERALGIVAEDLSKNLSDRLGAQRLLGAFLLIVRPGSRAGRAGLKAGDVITSVRGNPIASVSELGRAIDGARGPFQVTAIRRRSFVNFKMP